MTGTDTNVRDAIFQTLGEVQGRLAELRHIDTAMAYMEGERVRGLEAVRDDFETGVEVIEVEFSSGQYWFTRTYRVRGDWIDTPFGLLDDTKSERVLARVAELAREAEQWAAVEIDGIRDRVRPLAAPDSAAYQNDCIRPLDEMHRVLDSTVLDDFGRLDHSLSDWRGAAADNFADYFYGPFDQTLHNQKAMLLTLQRGISSAKAIAESTQHSVLSMVHETKRALEEQLSRANAAAQLDRLERQASARQALIIAGGTAAVFAGLLTAGSLWAASLTVIAGGTQIATAAIPEGGTDQFTIEGVTADNLLLGLSRGVDQIVRNDSDEHRNLRDQVDDVLMHVDNLLGGTGGDEGLLIPIRPAIVDGVDGETFYMP